MVGHCYLTRLGRLSGCGWAKEALIFCSSMEVEEESEQKRNAVVNLVINVAVVINRKTIEKCCC